MDNNIIALKVNGELKDLSFEPSAKDNVEEITLGSDEGLQILRHSAGHILAQAVGRLFSDVKYGIGPAVENGFYYDFANIPAFNPEDVKNIERTMLKIVNEQQTFVRRVVTKDEAKKEFKDQPYKLELIDKKGAGEEVSIYDNVTKDGEVVWKDLCMGPHLPTTKILKNAYKILRSSAAYWLGDESNDSMQRLYATAFASKEELTNYLHCLEEAKKRDHRKLGKSLDLFSFSDEIGSGLPLFHPKGGVLRLVMEDYSRKKHLEHGYSFVNTPHITKENLYKTSGHLVWYKDAMFPPMRVNEQTGDHDCACSGDNPNVTNYYLKPMNCPMHNIIYKAKARSYKELPLRLFEFGNVYRFEKSGVVHGLTRVRGLCMDDAHIYCTREQMKDELTELLRFIIGLLKDFGLNDFYLELSTKDPKKYVGDDKVWEEATRTLYEVGTDFGLELVDDPGGAAFYGPKISVQARDAIGRTWQMSTIQLDFNLPELFEMEYQDKDGQRKRPVMIHRALFGSVERFFGILTEHYAGAFPAWLSPVQVLGIPVADEYNDYLKSVLDKLRAKGVRVELDASDDRFSKKVRNATQEKVPFVLIAGEKDRDANAVSFRYRSGKQENGVPIDEAIKKICHAIETKNNDLDPV